MKVQRWTTPIATPAEHGGFVAISDYLILHEALRKAVVTQQHGDWPGQCRLCAHAWGYGNPESHAYDCLAKPISVITTHVV